MKKLRKLFYSWFKFYRRTDMKVLSWEDGDALLKSEDGPNWRIAPEDAGLNYPLVALERVERITE